MIRLLVADDHPIVREGIKRLVAEVGRPVATTADAARLLGLPASA